MSWNGTGAAARAGAAPGGWSRAVGRARRGMRGVVADMLAVAAFAGVLALLWWFGGL